MWIDPEQRARSEQQRVAVRRRACRQFAGEVAIGARAILHDHWLAQPDSTVLVAQSEEGVVGLAVLLTRTPSGFAGAVPRKVIELDNLVVRSDQRGRRVGRRLLAAAVEWSRQRRATHVEVAVHDFNRDARRFYENFGFASSIDRLVLAA